MKPGLSFSVLGPTRAWRDGAEIPLGTPQQRSALTVLLLHAGTFVSVEQITRALWEHHAPKAARGTVRTYIHRLRQSLQAPDCTIVSKAKGYALMVDPSTLDSQQVRQVAHRAHQAYQARDFAAAAEHCEEALSLWLGAALEDIHGDFAQAERTALGQIRSSLLELSSSAALALDRDNDVIQRMSVAVIDDPLHEKFHELLMLALYRTGRQAEAISAYGRVRTLLRDELGVDPSASLSSLYEKILRADASLGTQHGVHQLEFLSQAGRPEQLPAVSAHFVGRSAEIDAALQAAASLTQSAQLARVAVISGMAGVGKTQFATLIADRLKDRYPDGQLHVNLRGFEPEGESLPAQEVLAQFAQALGVPAQLIPGDTQGRTALFHQLLATRRVLLFLDNARDSAHVLPLIPKASSCLVLITSRSSLTGLVAATQAHVTALGPLSLTDARALMGQRLQPQHRLDEETAHDIIESCGRLPLALVAACAKACANPAFTLAAIAQGLRSPQSRLCVLRSDDSHTDVPLALSSSYRVLGEQAARLFRLLSLHPAPAIGVEVAACLLQTSAGRARVLLDELAKVRLLEEHTPGRYSWHDLVRSFAAAMLENEESQEERRHELGLLLEQYLGAAREAARLIQLDDMPAAKPAKHRTPMTYADAIDWFASEHDTLLSLIEAAFQSEHHGYAWQLFWMMHQYLDRGGHWEDLRRSSTVALQAARQDGSWLALAYAHRGASRVEHRRGNPGEAERHLSRSLELLTADGAGPATAYTRLQLCEVHRTNGEYGLALREAHESLKLFLDEDSPSGAGTAWACIAWIHSRTGHFEEAVTAGEYALRALQEAGEPSAMALILDLLAYGNRCLGHNKAALQHRRHAAELRTSQGTLTNSNDWTARTLPGPLAIQAQDQTDNPQTFRTTTVTPGHHLTDTWRKSLQTAHHPA